MLLVCEFVGKLVGKTVGLLDRFDLRVGASDGDELSVGGADSV